MTPTSATTRLTDDDRTIPRRQPVGLRAHERRLLLAAFPTLLVARLGLALLSMRRLQPLLEQLADATAAPDAHTDYAERAARAVMCASGWLPGTAPRAEALALLTLLRRRGLTGRLCEDVRLAPEGIQRHVSVVHNGRIVLGGPAACVAPLTQPPTAPHQAS